MINPTQNQQSQNPSISLYPIHDTYFKFIFSKLENVTIVAFVLNKYWTFEKYQRSLNEVINFGLLYSVTLGANVMTNKIVLELTNMVFLAFLVATGVSTILNFIGQKWWVFR